MIAIMDAKTGFVDSGSSHYQLGAYSHPSCRTYLGGKAIPRIDAGMILKVNEQGCTPILLPKDRLLRARELFICALQLYQDSVKFGLIKPKANDLYNLDLAEGAADYPRVTSILKVLNREGLNKWLVRESVKFTLKELVRTKKDPGEVYDQYEAGLFDPTMGAFAHRDRRGNEGTDLHRLIRNYLTGKPIQLSQESVFCQVAFPHFELWAKQVNLTLVEDFCEMKVVNHEAHYAGTLDAIVSMEG